jgi:hypothetical protein
MPHHSGVTVVQQHKCSIVQHDRNKDCRCCVACTRRSMLGMHKPDSTGLIGDKSNWTHRRRCSRQECNLRPVRRLVSLKIPTNKCLASVRCESSWFPPILLYPVPIRSVCSCAGLQCFVSCLLHHNELLYGRASRSTPANDARCHSSYGRRGHLSCFSKRRGRPRPFRYYDHF